jgi:hypothetical protein
MGNRVMNTRTLKVSIIFPLVIVVLMVVGCSGSIIPFFSNLSSDTPDGGKSVDTFGGKSVDLLRGQSVDHFQGSLASGVRGTLIIGLDENFGKLRNSINLALAKSWLKMGSSEGEQEQLFSDREVASFYFDSFRILNDFAALKDHGHFPQQMNSPANIVIIESLETGFEKTVKKVRGGYAIVDSNAISGNKQKSAEAKKSVSEKRKSVCRDGQQVSAGQQRDVHDIFVVGPVTKGIKNEKNETLSVGYLGKANNTELKYFGPGVDYRRGAKSEKEIPSLARVLLDTVEKKDIDDTKEGAKEGPIILSISYFKKRDITQITTAVLKNSAVILDIEEKDKDRLLEKQEDFLLLISLPNLCLNKNDVYEEDYGSDFHDFLDKFQEVFKNVIWVSASGFDTHSKEGFNDPGPYTHKREILERGKIEFFTVLGDYNISPTSVDINDMHLRVTGEPSTSFAAPALAAVVFNMLSMSPRLSSYQVKDILKRGALNYGSQSTKQVGYAVNPIMSYALSMGSLIANAQSDYYKCEGHIVLTDKDEWLINCDNNSQQGEGGVDVVDHKYSDNMLAFYDAASVHKSSLGNESSGIVQVTKSTNIVATSYHPEQIVIKILGIEYREKEIVVKIEKQFCSPMYSDTTIKTMLIDYSDRSSDKTGRIPRLKKELVVETTLSECKL